LQAIAFACLCHGAAPAYGSRSRASANVVAPDIVNKTKEFPMDMKTKTASPRSTKTEASQQFRDMAETGAKQSKEALTKIGAATNEAAEVMTNCCSTALEGIRDYNNKVVEFTQANTTSAFEFVQSLAGVKSPSEFVQVLNEHARLQLETMAEQTKQLATLTQHVALTAAEESLNTSFARAFNRAA